MTRHILLVATSLLTAVVLVGCREDTPTDPLDAGVTPDAGVVVCGDGLVEGDEACDDGNATAGDGCGAACEVEAGFTCAGAPSACAATCGDGLLRGAEACDDANAAPGDGCSAACAVEAGYDCTGAPSACAAICGDGLLLGAEACDDGNAASGDGCSAACAVEAGYDCTGAPSACVTTCGDGVIAGDEACDDGNATLGDGCGDVCEVEAGFDCTGQPSACTPICGDGIRAGAEQCDDGAQTGGDGCSATCAVEDGFTCSGSPSTCAAICGDGKVRGDEECDDADTTGGNGCSATCTSEPGYTCAGEPSICGTTCGDGVRAGSEICDDGNLLNGDGCNQNCQPSTGESCADSMATPQAVNVNGRYTWTIPASSVTTADGAFSCDPNGIGPDAVIVYTKTTGTLASGGKLLHVKADPQTTATAQFLNLEILEGACGSGSGQSLKCLWYKRDWDSYLDVPAGTYQIWVAKNSPATATVGFPQTTVTIEEVDASAAEGEGCFAPYTDASAIYSAPAGAGQPHAWTIPASINSFDMGPTWGEPGSISCDDTPTYGDIHGVDAVIEFNKTAAGSVLKIDVTNLGTPLTAADLNVEVLDVCEPVNPAKVSLACEANSDALSVTAGGPPGPIYVWVSTEATSEEFGGARVEITELFPGPGESRFTAEPLTASGAVTPSSTMRLDPPACLPATGNVHWYAYTFTTNAVSIGANAAGAVGVVDGGGQPLRCVTDASSAPLGFLGAPGQTIYLAIAVAGGIGAFTVNALGYSGVTGQPVDMEVTFPASAVTEFGMAVDATQLYLGGTGSLFSFPKTVGVSATQQTSATATQLGYDLVSAGGSLFSVDSTTSLTASRLFRLYDGAAWAVTPWDLGPTYPSAAPSYALATDGTILLMATRRTSGSAEFYAFSTATSSTPTLLGSNSTVWYVVGLAADDQFLYVASNGSAGEGVYRLSRANLAAPAVKLAAIDTDTLCNNIEVDANVSPANLYVRDTLGDLHVVAQPGSASAVHLGVLSNLGTASDYAMTYDKAGEALYFFETETLGTGRVQRLSKLP